MKKGLNEKLIMLARSRGISQTEIAGRMEVHLTHVNRYFNGRSDLYSTHLIELLRILGIDLDQLVSEKINKEAQVTEDKIETATDCLNYLFKNLDDLGQQTYLKNLAWATRVSTKKKLPVKVEEILKKELSLI